MCKDLFTDRGKRTFHILDLIFAQDPESYALKKKPSLSDRRANRASLKRKLLRELWNEDGGSVPSGEHLPMIPAGGSAPSGESSAMIPAGDLAPSGESPLMAPSSGLASSGESPLVIPLVIPQTIRDSMDDRLILLEDIKDVLRQSRLSGRRFFNPEDGSYLAGVRRKNVTYWVRWLEKEDGAHIISAYSHRMQIKNEL
jgi:hypothetical protein